MDKKQRELATNRLLEVIRAGQRLHAERGSEPERPPPPPAGKRPTPPKPKADETADKPPEAPPGRLPPSTLLGRLGAKKPPEPKLPPLEDEEQPPAPKAAPKPAAAAQDAPPKAEAAAPAATPKLPLLRRPPSSAKKQAAGVNRIISVDFGSSSVKVVEIQRKGSAVKVLSAESRAIPVALRKNETNLRLLQIKIAKELLPPARIRGAKVHLSLPEQSSLLRRLQMPSVALKERGNAIKFQLKKELPFPLDFSEISYRGWQAKTKEKQSIEALAIDRRTRDRLIEVLSEAEVIPNHISTASAAGRFLALKLAGNVAGKGAVAVVDIGALKTTITIIEGDSLVLCRTIATGSEDFNTVLQGLDVGGEVGELNDVQAEKYKLANGLPAENEPLGMRINILLRPVLERITAEISRSLDFYRRDRPDADVHNIFLTGGGAQMKRLPEFLTQNLGIEVKVGSVQDWATAEDPAGLGPVFLPALALALDDGRELNLSPPELLTALKVRRLRRIIPPMLIAVMVLLMGLYGLELHTLSKVEAKTESLKEKLTTISKNRAQFLAAQAEFNRLEQELAGRQTDFSNLRIGNPEIPVFMKALSNLVPPGIYLQRFHTRFIPEKEQIKVVEPPKGKGKGKASPDTAALPKVDVDKLLSALQDGEEGPTEKTIEKKRLVYGRVIELAGNVYPQGALTDVQLVDFVFALENSGYFRDVAVDSVQTLPDGQVNFLIICGI